MELAKLKAAKEDLERANKEREQAIKERNNNQEKLKTAEKKAEELRNKLNNPNLTEDERRRIKGQLILAEDEISNCKTKDKKYDETIKGLDKKIEEDLKVIKSIESSSLNEGFNLQDYLNLETAMIVIALFVVYQFLIKEDKR